MARVLVAEDSPTQAMQIRFLLEESGFGVATARNGVEAMADLRRQAPDIVVTDLQMPIMDGLALVEAVRHEFPSLPVVLITAHGSEETASQALRAGAASYVPKRNLHADLVATLNDILEARRQDHDLLRVREALEWQQFRFGMGNDESLVPPLLSLLEDHLTGTGLWDRTGLIQTSVALREALINAIQHGNLEMDSALRQDDERVYDRLANERRVQAPYRDRRVTLTATLSRAEATFVIRDEGPGFNPSGVPDPTDPANLERIGGRGLVLIRAFMDEVRHDARGNEITLVKRAPAGSGQ